jgi:hypothetical protein
VACVGAHAWVGGGPGAMRWRLFQIWQSLRNHGVHPTTGNSALPFSSDRG